MIRAVILFFLALFTFGCTEAPSSPPAVSQTSEEDLIINGHRDAYYSLRNISGATIGLGFSDRAHWDGPPKPVSNFVRAKDPEGYNDKLEVFDCWIVVRTIENSVDGFFLWFRPDTGQEDWESQILENNLGFTSLISDAKYLDGKVFILTDRYLDVENPVHKKYLLILHPTGEMENKLVSSEAEDIQITDSKIALVRHETKVIELIEP